MSAAPTPVAATTSPGPMMRQRTGCAASRCCGCPATADAARLRDDHRGTAGHRHQPAVARAEHLVVEVALAGEDVLEQVGAEDGLTGDDAAVLHGPAALDGGRGGDDHGSGLSPWLYCRERAPASRGPV